MAVDLLQELLELDRRCRACNALITAPGDAQGRVAAGGAGAGVVVAGSGWVLEA
jgi:hypothetical protein